MAPSLLLFAEGPPGPVETGVWADPVEKGPWCCFAKLVQEASEHLDISRARAGRLYSAQ